MGDVIDSVDLSAATAHAATEWALEENRKPGLDWVDVKGGEVGA